MLSSPQMLFVIAVELLSTKIRNYKIIKRINNKAGEFVVSQFADDTTFGTTLDSNSIKEIFREISKFTSVSGLKINRDKTEILPLGPTC